MLDLLGDHFMDASVEQLKNGSIFRGTGDNWDMKVKKDHMREEVQNDDLHLFASNFDQKPSRF